MGRKGISTDIIWRNKCQKGEHEKEKEKEKEKEEH